MNCWFIPHWLLLQSSLSCRNSECISPGTAGRSKTDNLRKRPRYIATLTHDDNSQAQRRSNIRSDLIPKWPKYCRQRLEQPPHSRGLIFLGCVQPNYMMTIINLIPDRSWRRRAVRINSRLYNLNSHSYQLTVQNYLTSRTSYE